MHVTVVRVDMLLNGTRISRQDAGGSHTELLTLASALAALIRVFPLLSKSNSKSQASRTFIWGFAYHAHRTDALFL
jgi:hypothetical protein